MNFSQRVRMTALLLVLICMMTPALASASAGTPSPELLHLISENSKLDLTPYTGKAIFLNFFTEWCGNCMVEMPDIRQTFDNYSEDELQIILVHAWSGEDETNSESVRKRFGMEAMTFFEDDDMGLSQGLGVQGYYPVSIFINKEGFLHTLKIGTLSLENMESLMDEMGVARKPAHD